MANPKFCEVQRCFEYFVDDESFDEMSDGNYPVAGNPGGVIDEGDAHGGDALARIGKNSVRFDMYLCIEIGNIRLAAKVKGVTWLRLAIVATATNHSCMNAVIA